jgi:hypothetical protein
VTVEVDGIGTLTNPIVAARAPEPAAAAAAEAITTGG